MLAIEAHGIVKTYGMGDYAVRALGGVDLEVRRGEMVAIMGPSGSGKSTLLHILGALDSPTEGQIAVASQRYETLDEAGLTRLRRDHIGFVFQFFNLLPSLTAAENVLLPALIARRRDDELTRRAFELLDLVGIGDRGTHLPSELSGGQQQRVSVARALLLNPELILATSRPATSTHVPDARSYSCCAASLRTRGTRLSWSRTTRPRPPWPIASSSCATASSPARSKADPPSGSRTTTARSSERTRHAPLLRRPRSPSAEDTTAPR